MAQTIQVESILRHPFSQDQRRFGAGVSLRRAGNGIDYLAISSVDMASAGGPADVRWYTLQNGIWEPVWHPLPDPIPYYRNFLSTPAN